MFKKNNTIPPKLLEVGYLKLDYLLKKAYKNKKKTIIIAPTGMKTFSKFTFLRTWIKLLLIF